ncbi:hypothetical protein KUCAC02_026466 [Chaenocephalus aceratus]|uniref:Uncharacterized protein n=1 Tax=Chaenocephalus aceratus TaxID=36190 RepID=A0ACB9VXJ5_CHAAC|nr:hypothetical protein KUCAC02_026466 [Chaenocephalus aceratus]
MTVELEVFFAMLCFSVYNMRTKGTVN